MIVNTTYTRRQLLIEEWNDRNSMYATDDIHLKYILHMVDKDLHNIKFNRRVSNDR